MKRCPKCNRSFDTSLDFCLEDGSRLISLPAASAPVTTEAKPAQTADQTGAFPIAKATLLSEFIRTDEVQTVVAKANGILPRTATPTNLIFEYAAIVIALAHNWWQWLYLEKQYMSSIMEYIFSANFLMWLLLLAGGTAVGLFV